VERDFSFWAVSFPGQTPVMGMTFKERRYIFRVPLHDAPVRWVPRLPDGSTGRIEVATPEEIAAYFKSIYELECPA